MSPSFLRPTDNWRQAAEREAPPAAPSMHLSKISQFGHNSSPQMILIQFKMGSFLALAPISFRTSLLSPAIRRGRTPHFCLVLKSVCVSCELFPAFFPNSSSQRAASETNGSIDHAPSAGGNDQFDCLLQLPLVRITCHKQKNTGMSNWNSAVSP